VNGLLTALRNSCTVGGGMLQTWLDMSSKMHMSFSFPQLMASMPTQELHLLELDTRREEGLGMWIAVA